MSRQAWTNDGCRAYDEIMEITAQDTRFMTTDELLALQSADAEAEMAYREAGFGNRYGIVVGGTTVADIIAIKLRDIEADPAYYGALAESMRAGQTAPLGVFSECLLNGAHRIAIAIIMGLPGLYVAEGFEGSTDEAFDDQHARTVRPALPVAA